MSASALSLRKACLSDPREKAAINEAGRKCLKSLLKKPTFPELMRLSRSFAVETGLISERALDAVEAVESHGGMASMAMLGDTVFATDPRRAGRIRRGAKGGDQRHGPPAHRRRKGAA